MTSTPNPLIGQLFRLPFDQPLSPDGKTLPLAYRMFYLTNSTTQATVYQDAALTTPYTQPVTANSSGQFSPIYLNPAIEYRSQLFSAAGLLLEDDDTVNNNTAGTPYVGGYVRGAFKASTTVITSNATPAADPDLAVYLPAAGTYKIDLDLVFTAAAAGATPGALAGLYFSGSLASGANGNSTFALIGVGTQNSVRVTSLAATAAVMAITPTGATVTMSLGTTAVSNTMRYSGTITTLTPGTLALNWSQAASSANSTSLLAGSALVVTQVF